MVTENRILMQKARESLKGNWGLAIGGSLTYVALVMLLSIATRPLEFAGFIIQILVSGPILIGFISFNLDLSRKKGPNVGQLLSGFENFWPNAKVYLLSTLYTLLWLLLLIIPGIIASIRYSQAYYIISENPKMDANQAIEKSMKMMNGNKWKYVCLGFRFFGWALLCILTLGVGFIWFIPYFAVSSAKFYDDVKKSRN